MALVGRKRHFYYGALAFFNYRDGRYDEAVRLWKGTCRQLSAELADRLRQRVEAGTLALRVSLDVPVMVQKPNHCGPCALAMIGR